MRILYVEDHEDTADLMQKFLERRGHHVTISHTAHDAIAACVDTTFDVWILDIELPDGHGGNLLRTLRRMDDHAKAIAISGHAYPHDITEGLEDGFDAYLVKPVAFEKVLEVVGA